MIEALARFVDALRSEGVSVSPAEIVDASRALDLVGLERRSLVRASLAATLAKDRASRATFARVFDRFFAPPRLGGKGDGEGRPAGRGEGSRAGAGQRPAKSKRPPRPTEEKARRPTAPVRGDQRQAGPPGIQPRRASERRDGRLRKLLRAARPLDERPDPVHKDLARRMTTEEERAIAREVPRVIEALRLRPGRRLAEARAGRPWLRQALRKSAATGGVPFVIPHRTLRPRATRVVLLVDVSFSVARAAGLFLLMASAFLDLGRRARVLAFVDRPVDVTAAIARWMRGQGRVLRQGGWRRERPGEGIVNGGVTFADVLDGISGLNLEAPSDYGRALHALSAPRLRPRGRHTVLVVLGDARGNRFDPLPWALEEIARGCRAVLWLVPEPLSRWGTADSALPAYKPSIDVLVEASNLDGLAAGLAELRRRL